VADGVTAGNHGDKYGTRNPLARLLVRRWRRVLRELVVRVRPESVLDVGCGEGVLTAEWASALPHARVLGADVAPVWPARAPGFAVIPPAPPLPFGDREWDLVCAVESLEHMDDPEGALAEMARCARRHVLVSVPHEPLWRALNLSRGAYVRHLGNTPGHLHHFTPRGLRDLAGRHANVVELRSPPPWTVALLAV
jgi:ubiquinone/menaquinone biosynthesis C-methylase UbiE